MRKVKDSWGSHGHMVWFCVPHNLELHGGKEIDQHFDKEHPGHKPFPNLFVDKKIKNLPQCEYLIVDCRKNRNVKV